MRSLLLTVLTLTACAPADTADDGDTDHTDHAETDDTDVTPDDPCSACDVNATCEGEGDDATCVCDEGYDGDGLLCADVDECEADPCDANATCTNADGTFACDCDWGFTGDGLTCEVLVDETLAACAVLQAEHPQYTTIARDVALCGGNYTPDTMDEACHTGWHVCTEGEWLARYPIRIPDETSDVIGPTIGTLTSWGAPQSARCGGDVWQADVPDDTRTWNDTVCHDPEDPSVASYNPWNDGKFLYADDGTTILQGNGQCCDWDTAFEATDETSGFAVYCCRDLDE